MINPDKLEEPVPPLSHLLFDEVTALRQEVERIRDQRDNADAVQAIQIAAAKQALQDVTEGVTEMEIEIARLRAELKTSNAERDEARRMYCDSRHCPSKKCGVPVEQIAMWYKWDCFKNQETT
jgi:septal ring factor EnvC (AmiA/AmiB activator)